MHHSVNKHNILKCPDREIITSIRSESSLHVEFCCRHVRILYCVFSLCNSRTAYLITIIINAIARGYLHSVPVLYVVVYCTSAGVVQLQRDILLIGCICLNSIFLFWLYQGSLVTSTDIYSTVVTYDP